MGESSITCDAVVLALGAGGMKRVLASSTELSKAAPDLAASASLNAIDVVAVRLWLDRTVKTDTPVGVFAKFPELRGAGLCGKRRRDRAGPVELSPRRRAGVASMAWRTTRR